MNNRKRLSALILVLLENNSGSTISLSYIDIAVNNTMVAEMISGTQIVDGAKCVTGMQRVLLEMMRDPLPKNKDINSVIFKFSILPIRENGGFSTADLFYSEKITLQR